MIGKRYILLNKQPHLEENLDIWRQWIGNPNHRNVKQYKKHGLHVSTIFLGLDRNSSNMGPPILFETMLFDDKSGVEKGQWRFATWDKAVAHHDKLIKSIEEKLHEKGSV